MSSHIIVFQFSADIAAPDHCRWHHLVQTRRAPGATCGRSNRDKDLPCNHALPDGRGHRGTIADGGERRA